MPTRRQLLQGIGGLTAAGLAATVASRRSPDPLPAQRARLLAATGLPVCGADKGPGTMWSTISAALGGLAGYRAYNTPAQGIPVTWPGPGASPVPAGVTLPVISIKPDIPTVLSGSLDAALAAFAALVPTGAMVTCWHEGEAAHNDFTTAQVLALHARCYPIFKAASPGCRYGQIVTCYTATRASGHYPLGQWMAPGLDFYGLDGYQVARSHTAATVFGAAAHQIQGALGTVRLAVTECNSALPASRPDWFKDTWSWARANDCLTYFTYWESAGSASPYAWLPDDTAAIAALAAINATSSRGLCPGRPGSRARQRMQGRAGEPVHRPLVHRRRAEGFVEPAGGRIPVEHPPFEPAIAALHADPGELGEQRPAEPGAPHRGRDVEILKVDAMPAQPGRVVKEPQREPRDGSLVLGHMREDRRLVREERPPQVILGGGHLGK